MRAFPVVKSGCDRGFTANVLTRTRRFKCMKLYGETRVEPRSPARGVGYRTCKPSPAFRTHHLHLVPFRSPLWVERLAFRDCLRRDPAVAAEYARLKRDLARRYECDREAYTEAKGPFVRQVLSRLVTTEPESTK
jgi:GrpB-like predicted nucleotidyltransferase (UPF0157 family)